MTKAFNAAAAMPWAIQPEWLRLIASLALRKDEDVKVLAAELGREEWRVPNLLDLRGGAALNRRGRSVVRDGVAILPVFGPLFPRAGLLQEMSGATSLEMLGRDLVEALERDDVKAVILDVDSPGGVAFGPGEFARSIRDRANRKPVVAYAGGLCASAAYYIAAAADEIVVDPSAMLGSVGVVSTMGVQVQPDADGYQEFEIVSSNAANKRPDPRTEDGVKTIRAQLDQIEAVFIADVAAYRGMTPDQVVERFGRGGVAVGQVAVDAGMADRTGSFEALVAELAAGDSGAGQAARGGESKTGAAAAARHNEENTMDWKDLTAEGLKEHRPDLVAAIEAPAAEKGKEEGTAAGIKAGTDAERDRIAAIDALALPGHEALIAAMKADGTPAADAATKIIAAEKEARGKALSGLKKDEEAAAAAASDALANPPTSDGGGAPAETDPARIAARKEWNADKDAQASCDGDFEQFFARSKGYFEGVASGKLRAPNKRG